jgi:hypothetical protein
MTAAAATLARCNGSALALRTHTLATLLLLLGWQSEFSVALTLDYGVQQRKQ